MKSLTDKERKEKFLSELQKVREETELIISQPQFFKIKNRIHAGIKSYTKLCPTCHKIGNECSPECYLGQNNSCWELFWHPKKSDGLKEDFEKALQYLDYLIPIIHDLPEFCFSESMIQSVRDFIKTTDIIFRDKYLKPKRLKQAQRVDHGKVLKNDIF